MSLVHSLSDNKLYPKGAKHVADAIATNTTLKELKYALVHPQPCCQDPLTFGALLCLNSLGRNSVGPKLGEYIAEALKVNKTLTSIEYATAYSTPFPAVNTP